MRKTILTQRELLKVLTDGVWTRFQEDKEITHYHVLDFNNDELLICFGGINWNSGETYYYPHRINQKDKDKTWFFENPHKDEVN